MNNFHYTPLGKIPRAKLHRYVALIVCVFVILSLLYFNSKETSELPTLIRDEKTFAHVRRIQFTNPQADLFTKHSEQSLLLCVLVKDEHSYGKGRNFSDMVKLTVDSLPNPGMVKLAMLITSQAEYENTNSAISTMESLPFAQIELYRPLDYLHKQLILDNPRDKRHDSRFQLPRRRMMASLRNTLMYSALEPRYSYVLWIDTDIVSIPQNLASTAIQSGRDIVVPSCYKGDSYYDWNTFIGERTTPNDNEVVPDLQGNIPEGKTLYVPRHVGGQAWALADSRFQGSDYVELTSVGGTWLLMSTEVILAGVNFGTFNVIGNTWHNEGYDGIETESVCFMANRIGKKCWGMPNVRIYHKND